MVSGGGGVGGGDCGVGVGVGVGVGTGEGLRISTAVVHWPVWPLAFLTLMI